MSYDFPSLLTLATRNSQTCKQMSNYKNNHHFILTEIDIKTERCMPLPRLTFHPNKSFSFLFLLVVKDPKKPNSLHIDNILNFISLKLLRNLICRSKFMAPTLKKK